MFAFSAICGCEKNTAEPPKLTPEQELQKKLIGKWIEVDPPYRLNNPSRFAFTADSVIVLNVDGEPATRYWSSSPYQVLSGDSIRTRHMFITSTKGDIMTYDTTYKEIESAVIFYSNDTVHITVFNRITSSLYGVGIYFVDILMRKMED